MTPTQHDENDLIGVPPATNLKFNGSTPMAPHGLGGMPRDLFGNGRLFATLGAHGGLLRVSYWGNQHLGASGFFLGDPMSAWVKLFRMHLLIDGKRYYLTLNNTKLFPFGYRSQCEIGDVAIEHDLLLLPDAIVQRASIVRNPRKRAIQLEVLHQESCVAINCPNRTWDDFVFDPERNALVTCCRDRNPEVYRGGDSLSQSKLGEANFAMHDAPQAETWIGMGSDLPLSATRGHHARSKHYLVAAPAGRSELACFMLFNASKDGFERRLTQLSRTVHAECAELMAGHEQRLQKGPQVDVGNPVLNSFFAQQPEMLHAMELPDRPGAFRGTLAGYFVWGWDGMMPALSMTLANAPEKTAALLRFWREVCHPQFGIPLQLTTGFQMRLNNAFPAQCQYIASLYHTFAVTGDLALVRELLPTCEFIIDQCRKDEVQASGLVVGPALWPDFPEAMGETGEDISSLNNSLLYQGLCAMAVFYEALGRTDEATGCRTWADRLRGSFVKYLYDEEQGYFISSCSSRDFSPRKHYCSQAIFWLTPFARDLVAHAPERIAAFMDGHLRSAKCLLSLPRWDTAWMADGNQLGASYPAADHFYLGVHKMIGDAKALDAWLGDVDWFWGRHTVPEAFTPEAENEHEIGPDNPGCKQAQCCSTWHANLYLALAGMDFDHDGITFTAWGDRPVSIRNLVLRGTSLDIIINGVGNHLAALSMNGQCLPPETRRITWAQLKGKTATIVLMRS